MDEKSEVLIEGREEDVSDMGAYWNQNTAKPSIVAIPPVASSMAVIPSLNADISWFLIHWQPDPLQHNVSFICLPIILSFVAIAQASCRVTSRPPLAFGELSSEGLGESDRIRSSSILF